MKRLWSVSAIVLCLLLALSAQVSADFGEAPSLADKVAAGQLPPVAERLPANPLVIQTFEEVGTYGGIIRMAHRGPADSTGYYRTVREPLVNFDPMLTEVHGNLAESWSVSEDGTMITFYLREGLRWSDGEPFTADDVLFWWEVMNTPELYPAIPGNYVIGGEPVDVVKLDNYTVQFIWPAPQAAFITWIASGRDENYLPKHYLSQYHINYQDEDSLAAMAQREGFDAWYQLFEEKAGTANNFRAPDLPRMDAWVITTDFDDAILVSERNPYYYKVDQEGNQLPYVDTLHRILVPEIEVMKLMLMAGEIDYITRHLWTTYGDLPMYINNQERGDYRIIRTHGGTPGALNIMFNATYDGDEALVELLHDYDFKKALSYAIDRDEVNDVLFNGIARPGHGHFHHEHPAYVEEVDQRYIEYNPELANQILDELGLDARDRDGYRLRPDGERLTLIIDGSTHHLHHGSGGELLISYWEDVGIRLILNMMERGLWETHREGNGHMLTFADLADPLIPLEQTGHLITYVMAPLWEQWFDTGGADGVEPPADAKRIREIYFELAPATDDVDVRNEYLREIAHIWGDNFWTIGTVGVPFNLSFASNDLRNVPENGAHSHPANPAVYQPYQWFWR